MPTPKPFKHVPSVFAIALTCATLLAGCGANVSDEAGMQTQMFASTSTFQVDVPALPAVVAAQRLQPAFHLAPVLLDEPDVRAGARPRRVTLDIGHAALPTRRLTVQSIAAARARSQLQASNGDVVAAAANTVVAAYTPAQIRAAYGFSAIPNGTPSAAQAAQLGAGQTIYIVDAMDNPNVATELAAFNQKFNLPACTSKTLSATTGLPLAAASTTACELYVVHANSAGAMSATAPAYDAGWATEIALDVQWAHASAPLARIVLIEAADASINSLIGGIRLANAMGPGVVSMSFGGAEGSWTASLDSAFGGAGMTYLAATGDGGSGVSWPAVSSRVVAVGGTTLTWNGAGTRSETGWSSTGGGVSAYTTAPAYQNSLVPGMGSPTYRNVADVAFNADPASGQYTAIMARGATSVSWVSAGGTSLATPQWAGFIAVANARRALAAKSLLGAPHSVLYGQVGAVPSNYAGAFGDVLQGANGSCARCGATTGYDTLTGLGTPNVDKLLGQLADGVVAPVAPTIAAARIDGSTGKALAFMISASGAHPLTYALSGAPGGMQLAANGTVTWASPMAGSYAVTVTATDSTTGASAKAVYTVVIASVVAPTVSAATVTGKPGSPLRFTVAASAANPITYSLSNAPSGMNIDSGGTISWALPVAGTYAVTVSVKDSKTGISGQNVITVKIGGTGPALSVSGFSGVARRALTGIIAVSDPGATSLWLRVSGAPLGMSFAISGTNLNATWANPQAQNVSFKVDVVDNRGATTQATVVVAVSAQ